MFQPPAATLPNASQPFLWLCGPGTCVWVWVWSAGAAFTHGAPPQPHSRRPELAYTLGVRLGCVTLSSPCNERPAPPPAAASLQGSTLLFGAGLSLVLTRKLGAQPWKQLAPQLLLIVAFTAELWTLIIPN